MCGRFASYVPPDAIRALFRTTNAVPNLPPSWNVAPTQTAMVVRLNPETNGGHLDLLHLWAVSRAVNSVRNNSPDLLDRIDDPHAPPPSDAPPSDNSA